MQTVVPEALSQEFSLERLRGLWSLSHADVVWRHDVDFSPFCAALMAAEEASAGIHSTYYFRVRGPYNIFDPEVADNILAVIELGHRVGIHVDTFLPRHTAIHDGILRDVRADVFFQWSVLRKEIPEVLFANGYQHKIPASFHAPPHELRWREWDLFDMADAYGWEGRYIADSRGVWRCHPETRLMIREKLQCNLHPEWYFLPEDEKQSLREQESRKP